MTKCRVKLAKDKHDVGLRLALDALAKDYGRKFEWTGPTLKSVAVDGDKVEATFDHTDRGLSFKGETNHLFALARSDEKWFWAPQLERDQVTLTSSSVQNPKSIRYAWSNMPLGALRNGVDLPAPPFESTTVKPQP